MTDYQFERTMKGSFNPFTLNVGEIEEYHEWEYSSESGQTVLLANGSWKALMPSNTLEMSDEMLEALADLFDFSVIP